MSIYLAIVGCRKRLALDDYDTKHDFVLFHQCNARMFLHNRCSARRNYEFSKEYCIAIPPPVVFIKLLLNSLKSLTSKALKKLKPKIKKKNKVVLNLRLNGKNGGCILHLTKLLYLTTCFKAFKFYGFTMLN